MDEVWNHIQYRMKRSVENILVQVSVVVVELDEIICAYCVDMPKAAVAPVVIFSIEYVWARTEVLFVLLEFCVR